MVWHGLTRYNMVLTDLKKINTKSAGCLSRLDVRVGWMSESAGCPVGWMSSRLDVQSAGCLSRLDVRRLDVFRLDVRVGWTSSRLDVQSAGCPFGWISSRLDVRRLDVFRLDVSRLDVRKGLITN